MTESFPLKFSCSDSMFYNPPPPRPPSTPPFPHFEALQGDLLGKLKWWGGRAAFRANFILVDQCGLPKQCP